MRFRVAVALVLLLLFAGRDPSVFVANGDDHIAVPVGGGTPRHAAHHHAPAAPEAHHAHGDAGLVSGVTPAVEAEFHLPTGGGAPQTRQRMASTAPAGDLPPFLTHWGRAGDIAAALSTLWPVRLAAESPGTLLQQIAPFVLRV